MKKIKLSISNIAWDSQLDEEMYKILKDKGFEGLEIAPTRIFEEAPYERLEEAKKFAVDLKTKYGLSISSMQSIWFGKTEKIFESEESREVLSLYTKKAIDFAEVIGCKNLVFGCPKNRNINDFESDYQVALNFFRELGDYALRHDVVIAIEPNPTIYNTNFLNTTLEAVKFVREVNLASVKINFDLGTIIYNEETLDILKSDIDYIHHIHISEPNLELIKERDLHRELFDILKEINYNNYVSIEMKKSSMEDILEILNYIVSLNEV